MKKIVLAAALFALASQACADTTVNGKISTLGLGVEAAFPITQSVDARIGFNTYKYSFNKAVTSGDATANYNGDLKLQSLQALADWHPWESSFRLSGGLVYNNNKFDMTATSGTFNNAGVAIAMAPGEYANATVDFDKVAPYLGVGWGRSPKNCGLSFTSDIGVMFQGTPKGSVTTNIGAATAADIANANASLNDSLKNFRIYPVLSIGIGYTF